MSGGPIEITLEELLIYEVLRDDGVEEREAAQIAREAAAGLLEDRAKRRLDEAISRAG